MTREAVGKVICNEVEFVKNFYLQDYGQKGEVKGEVKDEKMLVNDVAVKQNVNSLG